jgi:hypothetical protein
VRIEKRQLEVGRKKDRRGREEGNKNRKLK